MQKLSFTRAFVMDTVVCKQNTKKKLTSIKRREKNGINFHCIHIDVNCFRCIYRFAYFFSMDFFPWLKRMTSYAHTLRIWANLSIGICIYGWSEIFWIAIAKLWKTHQPTKALITLEAMCVPDHSLLSFLFGRNEINGAIEKKSRI